MRRLAAALVLLAAAPPPAAPAFRASGHPTPGGLVTVEAPAGTRLLAARGARIPPGPDGRFRIGIPRDATTPLRIAIVDARGALQLAEVDLAPRKFRTEVIQGLPRPGVPDPARDARRRAESETLARARALAAERPGEAAGFAEAFIAPAAGRVSGVFGARRLHGSIERGSHWGLDIANVKGTPVVAPAAGIVRHAEGPYLLQGNIVVLDHGAGLVSSFLHLSAIEVAPGQRVAQGARLGRMGSTGRSTGPHLHWGVTLVTAAAGGPHETRLDPALHLRPARPVAVKPIALAPSRTRSAQPAALPDRIVSVPA